MDHNKVEIFDVDGTFYKAFQNRFSALLIDGLVSAKPLREWEQFKEIKYFVNEISS